MAKIPAAASYLRRTAFGECACDRHWPIAYSEVTQVSTKARYAALARAEITDFRWHGLRHTWASWHVQNGAPLFALQELGGWESAEMVRLLFGRPESG